MSVKQGAQVAILRAQEPVGLMEDASDQQMRDMLKSLVSIFRVLNGRKQTPTALTVVTFIDSIPPIICTMQVASGIIVSIYSLSYGKHTQIPAEA